MKKEDQAPCFFSIMSANLRATSIANKVERVAEVSPKRKSIHVTLITTFGVANNAYIDTIQRIIVAEDLFRSISVR